MEHSFDIEIAEKYGIECAIILKHFQFWIGKNIANETHYHDGKYWTYSSIKALGTIFPYMSSKKIRNAINKLIDEKIIIDGNYNKSPYDRTKWYAFTEYGESVINGINSDVPKRANEISQKGNLNLLKRQMKEPKRANEISQKGEPIPDIKTDIYTYIKTDISRGKRFSPPTLEEVRQYCLERKNNVDAEKFVNFYSSKGWMVGKNRMKDWKTAVRTWERNNQDEHPTQNLDNELDKDLNLDDIF